MRPTTRATDRPHRPDRPDRPSKRRPKPLRTLPPEVLTDGEVQALLGTLSRRSPTGVRNRALIAVLYRSGLRLSEALSLLPKDLDLDAGQIRVLRGKGGRSRIVGIDPGASAIVHAWLAVRAAERLGRDTPLFCSLNGLRLTTAYIRRRLPVLARRAGIEKRVHAHGLRHTHAAQLRAEGVDIGIISKQLGHSSIATTVRYLDHIAPVAVIEAVRGRAWAPV
ncbi:MAG: tyrosine-type recombinase/integrase [Phycisphaerae bacterium]|nr:tyrosine-type recombinase/integrase [Phycisphaerae bacterium]